MTDVTPTNGLSARHWDMYRNKASILRLAIPLIMLLVAVSLVGLLYPSIYSEATPNWLAQTIGQDAVDLFLISPVLTVGALYHSEKNWMARHILSGTLLYVIYTFVIYCFAVSFNFLFLPYCMILGLSAFSFILSQPGNNTQVAEASGRLLRTVGTYFMLIAVVFYMTWLADILPSSFQGGRPASLEETGLLTNPVHALDLSIVLPATFVIGLMTWRGRPGAIEWASTFLVFFVLMDLTIATLSVVMIVRGVEGNYAVAIVMVLLAFFSTAILSLLSRSAQ